MRVTNTLRIKKEVRKQTLSEQLLFRQYIHILYIHGAEFASMAKSRIHRQFFSTSLMFFIHCCYATFNQSDLHQAQVFKHKVQELVYKSISQNEA